MASLCEEYFQPSFHALPRRDHKNDSTHSPSAHNYCIRTSIQKLYSEKRAKRVYFFKNGDRFYKGMQYAISPEKVRTFNALLEDVTRILIGLPQGVRYIFTLDGRQKITSLEQFEEGKHYVCSSTDHFCKIDYVRSAVLDKSRKVEGQASFSSLDGGNMTKTNKDYIRPKLLTIIRNGIKPRRVVRFLLNKKTAHSFEQVLDNISRAVRLDSGVVRKLFTLGGKQVTCLADFFGEEDILIAYGPEKYSHDDFELDAEESKYLARSPIVARKNEAGLTHQDSSEKLGSKRSPKKSSLGGSSKRIHDSILNASIPQAISQQFVIGQKIGDGNFATVYECTDKADNTNYALKVINKAKCRGKEHMITNEVAILRRVKHPNIVQLIEDFDVGERIYLVMELVQGGDLLQAITAATKYSERDASWMIADLMGALAYLHSCHIVHRDVKPENLLVIEQTAGCKSLKLGDFGLAIECHEPLFSVCGTPTYVAPEVLAETGYSYKVDIWASGVIMYILLCGFPPFVSSSNDQEELFASILAGKFTFLEPFWDEISDSAKDLISNMLLLSPDRRFSAQQVLEHPWIAENSGVPDRDLHSTVASKITTHFERAHAEPGIAIIASTPLDKQYFHQPSDHPPSPVGHQHFHAAEPEEEFAF